MSRPVASPPPIPAPPDFPVEWEQPEDVHLFWNQDRMHYPDPIGPLSASFEIRSFNQGVSRAAADYSMPIVLRNQCLHGYVYICPAPRAHDPASMAALAREAEAALQPAIARLGENWEQVILPELKDDVAILRGFDYAGAHDADLAAHLDWVVARRVRHWHLHFRIVFPAFLAASLYEQAYRQALPDADEMDPFTLLQGLPNKTVEGGHALWRLGREAAKSSAVRAAIALGEPAAVFARLEETPEGSAFARAFRAYLDEFGWRGDSWSIDSRTWVDDPRTPLATLRGYLAQGDEASPEAVHAELARAREAALAQVRDRLASAPPEVRGQFEGLLKAAQTANVLQEDHNYYIDQMLLHLSRRAFTQAGARLVARGQIADAEDVLYLTVDELRAELRSDGRRDLRPIVGERKARLAEQRALTPPPALGTPPPPPAPDAQPGPFERAMVRFFGGPPSTAPGAAEIRGNAGSRGKVTGLARVALTLDAASALQPGEILVCPTTAPPWTPLFATAAAVVTDTGGILSHCAVVAREFGIPAVVGTGVATATIRTGQRITVDGSAGIVTLEGGA